VSNDPRAVHPEVQDVIPLWWNQEEPADLGYFGVRVMVVVGEAGPSTFSDEFFCFACSPRWLVHHREEIRRRGASTVSPSGDVMFGDGLVLMERWSRGALRQAIEDLCTESAGPDWGVAASRLGRCLPWESQYKYDEYIDRNPGAPYPPTSP
jgi:hypothetical protein